LLTQAADQLFSAAKQRLYETSRDNHHRNHPEKMQEKPLSSSSSSSLSSAIKIVLEPNPKWKALEDLLHEIHRHHQEKQLRDSAATTILPHQGGARILIMVRDDRTVAQLREFLVFGHAMLLHRFRQYVCQNEGKKKSIEHERLLEHVVLHATSPGTKAEVTPPVVMPKTATTMAGSKKRKEGMTITAASGDNCAKGPPSSSCISSSYGMSVEELAHWRYFSRSIYMYIDGYR
jgi:hypothetical protein